VLEHLQITGYLGKFWWQ